MIKRLKFKRIIVISMIILLVIIIFIVILNRSLLKHPIWRVGDWFEINISSHRINGLHLWETVRLRYTILGEEVFYGRKCYVVANTILYYKDTISNINNNEKYYISKDDFTVVGVKKIKYDNKSIEYEVPSSGIIPWRYAVSSEMILMKFPIKNYIKYQPQLLYDNKGEEIARPEYVPYDKNELIVQCAKYEKIKFNLREDTFIRISTRTLSSNDDILKHLIQWMNLDNTDFIYNSKINITYQYVYRWKPGQIWWSQAWDYYPDGGATYRASLYSTSRDGILNYPLPKIDANDNIIE